MRSNRFSKVYCNVLILITEQHIALCLKQNISEDMLTLGVLDNYTERAETANFKSVMAALYRD